MKSISGMPPKNVEKTTEVPAAFSFVRKAVFLLQAQAQSERKAPLVTGKSNEFVSPAT